MYPKKVLQGVPNRIRTIDLRIFDFLIMSKCYSQLVRHGLLGHPCRFPCGPQILTAHVTPPLQSGVVYGIVIVFSWWT